MVIERKNKRMGKGKKEIVSDERFRIDVYRPMFLIVKSVNKLLLVVF